jgi:hypothetical protein
VALQLRQEPKERRDDDIVHNQQDRYDDGNGQVGDVGLLEVDALALQGEQILHAVAGQVIAVPCNR